MSGEAMAVRLMRTGEFLEGVENERLGCEQEIVDLRSELEHMKFLEEQEEKTTARRRNAQLAMIAAYGKAERAIRNRKNHTKGTTMPEFTVWIEAQQEESDAKLIAACDAQMAADEFAELCLEADCDDIGGETVLVKSADGKISKFEIRSEQVTEFSVIEKTGGSHG